MRFPSTKLQKYYLFIIPLLHPVSRLIPSSNLETSLSFPYHLPLPLFPFPLLLDLMRRGDVC